MRKRRKTFASFGLAAACKELPIIDLLEWALVAPPIEPSKFYYERLRRVESVFDTRSSERAKEVLIDAICEEVLLHYPALKMWKAATIQSDSLIGTVDYVAAPQRDYLDNPLLCIVEAKKDDFEYGLTQCLVAMKVCQHCNESAGNNLEIYSAVTNGEGWKFYKFTQEGQVYESPFYAISNPGALLGCLHYIFTQCANNIAAFAKAA